MIWDLIYVAAKEKINADASFQKLNNQPDLCIFFKKYSIKFSKREKNTQIVHITNILQVHHKPQGYKERGLFVLFQEVVLNWKWK